MDSIQPEHFCSLSDNSVIAGCDEAGRGPLAGPVCAACVILPDDFPIEILNDSKKLNARQRQEAESLIKERAVAWAVTFCSHSEIDRINILNASLKAMLLSFEKAKNSAASKGVFPDVLLVDGNRTPQTDFPCMAIVKGDSKIPQIMAASILAKTARDRFMQFASVKWPGYGFERHMGYPTKAHYLALKELGPCPIHRLTFKLTKEFPDH